MNDQIGKCYFTEFCDSTKRDLYKILGCSPNSSSVELKQAYHRLILEFHPDKNLSPPSDSQTFQVVKEAWDILGNPDLKRKYDLWCKQAEFEAEGTLLYARLVPKELEATDDEDILSYPCRCGNSYLVQKTDLQESQSLLYIPCQDCTFVIAVAT